MVTIRLHTLIAAPNERCFDLSLSIETHLAGQTRSRERAVGGVTSGVMRLGDVVRWEATHFFVRQHLSTRITAYERPTFFADTMVEGAFDSLHHEHRFEALGATSTRMSDVFSFGAPLGMLGRIAESAVLERYMRRLLVERNAALKAIAESDRWRELLPEPEA